MHGRLTPDKRTARFSRPQAAIICLLVKSAVHQQKGFASEAAMLFGLQLLHSDGTRLDDGLHDALADYVDCRLSLAICSQYTPTTR
jgi:hypothetical protein